MNHTEHNLQAACITWFRMQYPTRSGLLFAIPNGAKLAGTPWQRAKTWKRFEAEGALPGAADLFLAIPSGDLAGLFIEMKTKQGRQSDTQAAFEAGVVAAGYGYAMPRSLDEFIRIVRQYLEKGVY